MEYGYTRVSMIVWHFDEDRSIERYQAIIFGSEEIEIE